MWSSIFSVRRLIFYGNTGKLKYGTMAKRIETRLHGKHGTVKYEHI